MSFARRINAPFFETSAKNNINVQEAVQELIRRTPRQRGKEYKLVILGECQGEPAGLESPEIIWSHDFPLNRFRWSWEKFLLYPLHSGRICG